MIVRVPPFRQSFEWRKLTAEERAGKPWKYVLLRDVFIEVETGLQARHECSSGGVVYMILLPHGIVMRKGYAWNGNTASPDRIAGRWLIAGSLPHDGLFQFSGTPGFPRDIITLPWANWLYLRMSPPWIGWAYYAGLVSASWALWGKPPKNGEAIASYPLHLPEPV